MNLYFTRVGYTSTGRPWYRCCHRGGKPFGRRFCIKPSDVVTYRPRRSTK